MRLFLHDESCYRRKRGRDRTACQATPASFRASANKAPLPGPLIFLLARRAPCAQSRDMFKIARPALDSAGDALRQQPPRDAVPVPRVDDDLRVLVEQSPART